jgi:hypothetical protein
VVRRGSDNKSAWMQLLWQLGIAVLQSLAAGSRALGSSALPPAPQLLAPSAGLFAAAAAARHRGAVLAELARRRVDERPDYDVCRGACGARARCRFRNRGTNSLSESGVEWMNGRTKFECDRTLGECGRVVRRVPAVAPAASAAVRCGQCASQSCFGALCGVLGEIDSTHRELHWKSQYFLQAECCRKLPTHCRSSRPLCGPSAHRGLNHRACPDFFRLPGCSARWFEAHAPAGCADVAAFAQQLLVSGGEGAAEVDKGALVIVGVLCKATSILTVGSPRSSLGGGTSMGSGWCRLRAPLSYMYRCQSEKDAKLAQKLGQLQPFIAVFPQECTGQLALFGATQHLSRSWTVQADRAAVGAQVEGMERSPTMLSMIAIYRATIPCPSCGTRVSKVGSTS